VSHLALARRVERVNASALLEHVDVCQRLFPDTGAEALNVAGGVASFVGAEVVASYAVGLGLEGKVTAEDVGQVAEFYRSHGTVPRIDVCPLADPLLLEALRAHNFQLHWFTNILVRPFSSADDIPLPSPEITIREVGSDEADLWVRTVDAGFAEGRPLTEPGRRLATLLFHCKGSRSFLAEVDGRLAGASSMFTDHGYLALSSASVLPQYRNRGIHTALIRHRLGIGRELGCDLAGFFAMPGSVSQHNAERHGFRLLYSRATMKMII
jgi:ribosomal protein S18 acetylase RimI-like enzyme